MLGVGILILICLIFAFLGFAYEEFLVGYASLFVAVLGLYTMGWM